MRTVPEKRADRFIKMLLKRPDAREIRLRSVGRDYGVVVHSPEVLEFISDDYCVRKLDSLARKLQAVTVIAITDSGRVRAADRSGKWRTASACADPTHYDAVWVRDSLWVYLSLNANRPTANAAKKVLFTLLEYMSTSRQLRRMKSVIDDPSLLMGTKGPMNAVHVRFDSHAEGFQDVTVKGRPQYWNHLQNDAIGLLLDLVVRALRKGEIEVKELSLNHWSAICYLTAYLSQIAFYQFADSGCWEEVEKVNTSSVGLVTSAFEELIEALDDPAFRPAKTRIEICARRLGISKLLQRSFLERQCHRGYITVLKQLDCGGESPFYNADDARYRLADAALLNLIYPARLRGLDRVRQERILGLVRSLFGRIGIKRYFGDSYQSGNSWFMESYSQCCSRGHATRNTKQRRAASRAHADICERNRRFLPGTEAEWFFDSWYSKACGQIYRRFGDEQWRYEQLRSFNRSLGQITGCFDGGRIYSADGAEIPDLTIPESYNLICRGDFNRYVPSPITPLNWAKASLVLALGELKS